jgi:putative peptidoglycan lipid II flippase
MEGKKRITGLKLAIKTSVVSGMTLLSRILGLVRDVVFARFFGAGLIMDAFLVAQRIPNMLRRFFAEGAFSAGFVPVMARYKEQHDHDEAREYLGAMAGTFGIVLFVVAALMLRFTFPYLFFVSLTAFAGGILNTYGRFGVPAFTPVILNVVLIFAAVWVAPLLEQPVMALAYAVFIAGLLQLMFQLPFLAQIHALPRPRWRPKHKGVRRAFKLMVPAIFGSSVAQINVLLSGIIASLLPVGSISYLYYSDRLMEFPLGLFGIALATVTLPYLSRLWANGDRREFAETLEWSMRIALLIAVPAAAGLIILAAPLIITLFHGGEFDARSVAMTVLALQAYAGGLVGFSFVKVLAPAFFAREDTRTPVRIGIAALLVNLVLGASSAWYLSSSGFDGPHVALAAATSVAAILNALLLYFGLRRANVISHGPGWGMLLLRVALANGAMIVTLLQLQKAATWWLAASLSQRVVWLAVSVVAGAGIYFIVLLVLGLRPSQLRMRHD